MFYQTPTFVQPLCLLHESTQPLKHEGELGKLVTTKDSWHTGELDSVPES